MVNLKKFDFEGMIFIFRIICNCFIIMNFGYVGCLEFFDNLKVLFWIVVMMVFDYVLILEIIFYFFGYFDV